MGIKLCISGICGRMGRMVESLARQDKGIDSIVGIELGGQGPLPDGIFNSSRVREALQLSEVLLVFSNDPESAVEQAQMAAELRVKVVIATTGFSPEQDERLVACGQKVAVIKASNFSLGINLLGRIVAEIARALAWGYQAEIVEEHHARKLDAPSGTAVSLARTIALALGLNPKEVIECGRTGRAEGVRPNDVIGIQSVRAGNIAGNHEVIFAGPSEVIRIRHEALSPQVFAEGALVAVKWIARQSIPAWYSMADVLGLR